MSVLMRAMRDFRGKPGEGKLADGRHVEAENEFTVANEGRAKELEMRGLAVPAVAKTKREPNPKNKMEPKLQNKAAEAGPLPSPGGRTGEDKPPSSSPEAPAPRPRRARKPEGGLDL